MEPQRFDAITRVVHDIRSRRGALAAFVGVAVGFAGLESLDAKNKKKDKHKKKRQKRNEAHGEGKKKRKCKKPKRKCGGRCVDARTDNAHCGGCNQACVSGATCVDGLCNSGGTPPPAPPTTPPVPPITPSLCPECGRCEVCNADSATLTEVCSGACPEACLAQSLCNIAQHHADYLTLQHYLVDHGYTASSDIRASYLQQDGVHYASLLITRYDAGAESALLSFVSATDGTMDALVTVLGQEGIAEVLVVTTSGQVGPGPQIVVPEENARSRQSTVQEENIFCKDLGGGPVFGSICEEVCGFALGKVGCEPGQDKLESSIAFIKAAARCRNFAGCIALGLEVFGLACEQLSGFSCEYICDELVCDKDPCAEKECGTGERCRDGKCVCVADCCKQEDCPRAQECLHGGCYCPVDKKKCNDGSCSDECCPESQEFQCLAEHYCAGDGRCYCVEIGFIDCGDGQCRDLDTDPEHCGGCVGKGGVACPPEQDCVNGDCVCIGGEVCGDACCSKCEVCVDPVLGECIEKDECRADQFCEETTGDCECYDDTFECSGKCRDFSTDRDNCGGCVAEGTGRACDANEECRDSHCVCKPGFDRCEGVCRNHETDSDYCGGCPAEGTGEQCRQGEVCRDYQCACEASGERCGTCSECRSGTCQPRSGGGCGCSDPKKRCGFAQNCGAGNASCWCRVGAGAGAGSSCTGLVLRRGVPCSSCRSNEVCVEDDCNLTEPKTSCAARCLSA